VKKDNIIKFKKNAKVSGTESHANLFCTLVDAVDSVVDDKMPMSDVMENLVAIVAIMAKGAKMTPAGLLVCVAATVEAIYDYEVGDDDE